MGRTDAESGWPGTRRADLGRGPSRPARSAAPIFRMMDHGAELSGELRGEAPAPALPFWSRDKLDLLRKYLAAYVRIMTSPLQRRWLRRFSYIDAFSNQGQYGDEETGT